MAQQLPGVYITIEDGTLQLISGSPESTVLNVGLSAGGTVNTPIAFGSPQQAKSTLLAGPLLSYVNNQFAVTGGPVLVMPALKTADGAAGDGVYSGSQQGTISVTFGPVVPFSIKIIQGGASGTYSISLNSAAYGPTLNIPQLADGYTATVGGLFSSITFSTGGTNFVTGDVYAVATNGTITHTGTGTATITQSSSPVDSFTPDILIDAYGTSTTSPRPRISWTLDGTDANLVTGVNVPSTNKVSIDGSGLILNFSGIFNAGDGYSFQVCGPTFSGSSLTSAINAIPNTLQYSLFHVVRGAASLTASDALSECSLVNTALELKASVVGTESRGMVPVPSLGSISVSGGAVVIDTADTDAVLTSTFQNFVGNRTDKIVGDVLLTDPVTGLQLRRPLSWCVAARNAKVAASQMASATADGTLIGVTSIFRDEFNTPALDAAHFTTARTFPAEPGFYITNDFLCGGPGSNFQFMVFGRVADQLAFYARQWGFPLINARVPTNPSKNAVKGSILPSYADVLDNNGTQFLRQALVPSDFVDCNLRVDRQASLRTLKLPVVASGQVYLYSQIVDISVALVLSLQ